jgi:hypothetical protein
LRLRSSLRLKPGVSTTAELPFDDEEFLFWCRQVGCRIGETPILSGDRRSGTSKIHEKEILQALVVIFRLGISRVLGRVKISRPVHRREAGRDMRRTRRGNPLGASSTSRTFEPPRIVQDPRAGSWVLESSESPFLACRTRADDGDMGGAMLGIEPISREIPSRV